MDIRQWLVSVDDGKGNTNRLYEQRQLQDLLTVEMKEKTINMLEYTYLVHFIKGKSAMVNSDWFTELMLKILIKHKNEQEYCTKVKKLISILFGDNITENMDFNIGNLVSNFVNHKKDKFVPTDDQQKGIFELCKFLKDHSRSMFGMYGYAGTGKTTTITEILHYLLHTKNIQSIAFTAPTNKAVNICKSKFRSHIIDLYNDILEDDGKEKTLDDYVDKLAITGMKIDFITIHRLLNYKNDFDLQGERIFIKGNDSLLGNYDVIIVDECSMIPLKIINDMMTEVNRDMKMTDNYVKIPKIIFIGDPAQLPPVNEAVSTVFIERYDELKLHEYMSSNNISMTSNGLSLGGDVIEENKHKMRNFITKILEIDKVVFRHIVRNNNDSINNLCNEIRSWIFDGCKPQITKYVDNEYVKLYNSGDITDKTKTKWFKRYLKELDEGTNNIILTWTNKQMDIYNDAARKYVFRKDEKNKNKIMDEYVVNDVLILNDFYNFEESNNGTKFYTSEQIKVVDTFVDTIVIKNLSGDLGKSISKIKNFGAIHTVYKKYIDKINVCTHRKYKAWRLNVVKLCECNTNVKPNTYDIITIHNESREQLNNDKKVCMEIIKSMRYEMMNKFKSQIKTIDRAIIKKIWKEWSKLFIDQFANVNYGFTITSHKSQGSTFYNVYVDCEDILNNNNNNEAKRCMYTSLTRASNKLKLLV